jgi:hypothetical protein
VRGSADQPLATALNQLQPTRPVSGRQADWLPDCLLDQGRNVAEYLAVPSRLRDCEC